MEEIDLNFKDFPPIRHLISKYSLSPTAVVCFYLLLAFLFTLSHSLGWFVVLVTGILYPGYRSVLAIMTQNEEENQLWISFWIIFNLHNFIDYLFANCLSKIPFYYSTRLLITIYMFWPTTKGSLIVFKAFEKKLGLDKKSETGSNSMSRKSSKDD